MVRNFAEHLRFWHASVRLLCCINARKYACMQRSYSRRNLHNVRGNKSACYGFMSACCIHGHVLCVSYEEDTCVSYLAYMVTSSVCHMRRRIHVCHTLHTWSRPRMSCIHAHTCKQGDERLEPEKASDKRTVGVVGGQTQ